MAFIAARPLTDYMRALPAGYREIMANKQHTNTIELRALNESETSEMARTTVTQNMLSEFPQIMPEDSKTRKTLFEKTLGNPMLIKRMANAVRESYLSGIKR